VRRTRDRAEKGERAKKKRGAIIKEMWIGRKTAIRSAKDDQKLLERERSSGGSPIDSEKEGEGLA